MIGNTFITIFNHGKRDFKIKRGGHVLKLVIGKIMTQFPMNLNNN